MLQAFERCVFNVIFNNRDDHSKNFSFLMDRDGRWKFSPAYDLTFSDGPNGEHQMDICGEAREPGRTRLLQLAERSGITKKAAAKSIEKIAGIAEHLTDFVEDLPIRKTTMHLIETTVSANLARF